MRRAAKVDANQEAIVTMFRALLVSVQHLHAVGGGVPDLLCATPHWMFLVEVKDGSKPPSAQKLTPDQEKWHASWPLPVHIVRSTQDVIDLVLMINNESKELKHD